MLPPRSGVFCPQNICIKIDYFDDSLFCFILLEPEHILLSSIASDQHLR